VDSRPDKSDKVVMKLESAVRILAGTMVLTSLALAHWVSPWWLLLAAFVGFNLIQSALTGFCPAEMIFRALGVGKGGPGCCG
jgi:Inner membrane protein YgaP-like, transmembrane domain